jgi:hypothetical protein
LHLLRSPWPERKHRAGSSPDYGLGNAAHQETRKTGPAMRTHDDEIDVLLLDQSDNCVTRRSIYQPVFVAHPFVGGMHLLQMLPHLIPVF